MKNKTAFILAVLILIGCLPASAKNRNKKHPLTSRYNTINPVPVKDVDPPISVSVQVFPTDKNADKSKKKDDAKTFFDLKSGGQKAIVDQIVKKNDGATHPKKKGAAKGKDANDKIGKLLNAKFQEDKDHVTVDLTEKKINIVFSVSEDIDVFIKHNLSMADRIEKLYVTVTLDDNSKPFVKFINWDKINTQYGQFDIASVSFSASKATTVNPSIPIGSSGVAASLGSYANTKTYQEADSLMQRFILLNGILNDDNFTLQQTGTPAIDLLGNTSVNLTLKFTTPDPSYFLSFDDLRDDDNKFNPPGKVEVSRANINYPQLPVSGISGNLTCHYVIRHVRNEDGQRTYTEGDDDIEYHYGSFSQPLSHIVRVEDSKPKVWSVSRGFDNIISLVDKITGGKTELHFSNYDDALEFEKWLIYTSKTLPPDKKITIQDYTLDMKNTGEFSIAILP